jgi:thiamine-phosphate pyrophosphorylase
VFGTTTKRTVSAAIGLKAVRAASDRAAASGIPVVAIGGITSENAPTLVDAGVDAVAVISDVFAHDDLADVTRAAARIAACFG